MREGEVEDRFRLLRRWVLEEAQYQPGIDPKRRPSVLNGFPRSIKDGSERQFWVP